MSLRQDLGGRSLCGMSFADRGTLSLHLARKIVCYRFYGVGSVASIYPVSPYPLYQVFQLCQQVHTNLGQYVLVKGRHTNDSEVLVSWGGRTSDLILSF